MFDGFKSVVPYLGSLLLQIVSNLTKEEEVAASGWTCDLVAFGSLQATFVSSLPRHNAGFLFGATLQFNCHTPNFEASKDRE